MTKDIIIPIHDASENNINLLKNAVTTTKEYLRDGFLIHIVAPKDVAKRLPDFGVDVITHHEDTDFASQVNYAVKKVQGKYFSVLEIDDTYHPAWFISIDEYLSDDSYDAYLPLGKQYTHDMKFISYANQMALAESFADENGILTNDMLLNYKGFYPHGAFINRKKFIDCGGLKPSISFGQWYEFLLRFTNSENRIIVIPKAGYNHTIGRPGSYDSELEKTMTTEQQVAWLELCTQEYIYKEDRKTLPGENKTVEE